MRSRAKGWFRLLAVTAVMAAACGPGNPPATGSATSPAPTNLAASPSPTSTNLALVTLKGSSSWVVRDLTDINHPKTVSNLGAISAPVFVSGTEISYADNSGLVRTPLAGSPKTIVVKTSQGVGLFAWSPDGRTVVYTTESKPGTATVHQLSAGQDRVLGSVPAVPAVGCETIANCFGADTWDFKLTYSPDGAFISLVTSVANVSVFRLWSSDGKVLKTSDSQSPFMAAWSGRSLYFRDAKGVEVWRDGTVSSFLPGVAWIRPKASPGGGQIVYETRDAQRWAHTYVVDTTSGKVRDLGKAHAEPVFLTTRYIWYQGERACVAADQCGTRVAGVPSGKTYIYDLQDGTETESLITSMYDVWPHAA
jgi:Tol biopolymer transport system component